MPEILNIVIQELGAGRAVVAVAGEADFDSSPALVRACTDLIDRGRAHLVLELSGLGFCDSSGINALVRVRKLAMESGGSMVLAAVGEVVGRILAVSGVDAVITAFATVPDALAAAPDGDGAARTGKETGS